MLEYSFANRAVLFIFRGNLNNYIICLLLIDYLSYKRISLLDSLPILFSWLKNGGLLPSISNDHSFCLLSSFELSVVLVQFSE